MDEITRGMRAVRAQRLNHIMKGFVGNEPEQEIEKSDVMNAIQYGGDIKITKTGKEIKKQVTDVLIPELNAQLEAKQTEADSCLEDCGKAPTQTPNPWWTDDLRIAIPYKIYDWSEMEFSDNSGKMMSSLSPEIARKNEARSNPATSAEEADARRKYNDCVRAIANIMVDLEACRIIGQLKDNKEYELTPKQLATFRL